MPTVAVGTPGELQTYTAWLGASGDGRDEAGLTVPLVGGKGASLDRLVRSGFTVPPAFSLTTDAFAAHLAGIADRERLERCLAALPAEAERAALAELVEGSPMPDRVDAALGEALATLSAALPAGLRGNGVAVRSSGVEEDGSSSSFAGLHETRLGVPDGEVSAAVRACWASLWSRAAIAYRTRRGLPVDRAAMAVVVQALVPADAAAVAFTRHPVTGRDDRILITTVRGLGEPMVAGTVTPDTIVVDRPSRSVVEWVAGDGAASLVVREGRVVEGSTSDAEPALSSVALDELVVLSLEVERSFGAPVDIEAARAGGRWYLLQARPITTR
jgi:pyruvate,water dikinase